MATIILSPAAELNIVCDQGAVFPATDFTYTNKNTGLPIDLSDMVIEVEVRESNSGPIVLAWSTEDDTLEIVGDDSNTARLTSKTEEEMNIEAKSYLLEKWITQTGLGRVRYFYGNLIVRPTGG
jgi:hypothetical protein